MRRVFNCDNSDDCYAVDHYKSEADKARYTQFELMAEIESLARANELLAALAEKYKLLQSMCMICVERKCAECKDYNRIQKEADE